jgi:HSP20 family protein
MSTLLYNTRPAVRPARAFNSLLTELLRDAQPTTPTPSTTFVPAADIFETAQGFELHLALPGVAKDAVSLDFQDNQLVAAPPRPPRATMCPSCAASKPALGSFAGPSACPRR